jgi:hypothetical protein
MLHEIVETSCRCLIISARIRLSAPSAEKCTTRMEKNRPTAMRRGRPWRHS